MDANDDACQKGLHSQEDDSQVAQWGHFWLVHTSTVELLLNNADALHLDLNSKNNIGNTGFHLACLNGQTSTVELLLNNADALHLDQLTSKGYNGKTAFQQAQFKNKTAVVELIKAKRPSIAVQISYVIRILP